MNENNILDKINEIEEILTYKEKSLNKEDKIILFKELNKLNNQLNKIKNKSNKKDVNFTNKNELNKKYISKVKKHSPGTKSEIKRFSNKKVRLNKEFNSNGSLYRKMNKEYYELWY